MSRRRKWHEREFLCLKNLKCSPSWAKERQFPKCKCKSHFREELCWILKNIGQPFLKKSIGPSPNKWKACLNLSSHGSSRFFINGCRSYNPVSPLCQSPSHTWSHLTKHPWSPLMYIAGGFQGDAGMGDRVCSENRSEECHSSWKSWSGQNISCHRRNRGAMSGNGNF